MNAGGEGGGVYLVINELVEVHQDFTKISPHRVRGIYGTHLESHEEIKKP